MAWTSVSLIVYAELASIDDEGVSRRDVGLSWALQCLARIHGQLSGTQMELTLITSCLKIQIFLTSVNYGCVFSCFNLNDSLLEPKGIMAHRGAI